MNGAFRVVGFLLIAVVVSIFVMPFVPFGFILFVFPLVWAGLWFGSEWLKHRHEIKNLDDEFAKVLDTYRRDR